jgi:hypothetical protein
LESLSESIPGYQVKGIVEKFGGPVETLGNRVADRHESLAREGVWGGIAGFSSHAVLCDKKPSETRGAAKIFGKLSKCVWTAPLADDTRLVRLDRLPLRPPG